MTAVLEQIRLALKSIGVDQFGICDYSALSVQLPCRAASQLPQGAKSVIVCAFPYYTPTAEHTNLCGYARVEDYHRVVPRLLDRAGQQLSAATGGEFVAFSDISPLPEKEAALRAGVGYLGRNGLVTNKRYGSYFVIGELVTGMELEPAKVEAPFAIGCAECGRCEQDCPSGALQGGYHQALCLSRLTQQKGELTPEQEQLIQKGGLVWGCDRCQEVCPHNQGLPLTPIADFAKHVEPCLTEENLDRLMKDRAFGYKGKKLLLRNLSLLKKQ